MGLEVGWRSEGRSIEKMGDCAEREKWQIWNINNIEMSIEIGTQNQVMLRGKLETTIVVLKDGIIGITTVPLDVVHTVSVLALPSSRN